MRVPFKPLDEKDYLKSQQQHGNHNVLTLGSGFGDITIFRDRRLRRGSNAFTNLIFKWGKRALPFLQKYILPEAKEFTKNMAGDIMSGNTSAKQAFRQRGLKSLKNVGQRLMSGEGRRRRAKGVKRMASKRKKIGCGTRKKKGKTLKKRTGKKKRRGGAIKKKKKRLVVRKKRKHSKSLSMSSVDCSRPTMKKFCKKDIFS